MVSSVKKLASLSPSYEKALDDHLNHIKRLILIRASELSNPISGFEYPISDSTTDIEIADSQGLQFNHLAEAINDYAPGNRIYSYIEKSSRWERFMHWFPPFTIICFLLAIAFALFGIYTEKAGNKVGSGSGFVDIAKIFAGALVGSTTSSIAANMTRRPKNRN